MSRTAKVVSILIAATIILAQIYNLTVYGKVEQVDVIKPAMTSVYEYVTCSGTIYDGGEYAVYSQTPLYITSLEVSPGDTVNAGDIIAYYDSGLTFENYVRNAQTIVSEAFAPQVTDNYSSEVIDSLGLGQYFNTVSDTHISYFEYSENGSAIYAESAGVVDKLNLSPGEYTQINQPLYSVRDKSSFYAVGTVDESNYSKLVKGQKVTITGAAFPNDKAEGYIESISTSVSKQFSGTTSVSVVECIIRIDQPVDSNVPSGASVDMKIEVDCHDNSITVPYTSVLQDEKNNEYVLVYNNGTLEKRIIETDTELSTSVVVKSGLKSGEYIALSPSEDISVNTAVKAVLAQ